MEIFNIINLKLNQFEKFLSALLIKRRCESTRNQKKDFVREKRNVKLVKL